jgi:HK97 family phage major capsid protein
VDDHDMDEIAVRTGEHVLQAMTIASNFMNVGPEALKTGAKLLSGDVRLKSDLSGFDIEKVALDSEAADEIADRVADRLKAGPPVPRRSQIEPNEGIVEKFGSSPAFYGGLEAKYGLFGDTDTDIAIGAYLTKTIVEARGLDRERPARRETANGMPIDTSRLTEVMVGAATRAIKAAPVEVPAYVPNGAGGLKAQDVDRFVGSTYREMRETATKAMVSTTSGSGDEWVPTFATSELWREVHLATSVSASVPRVAMPTNPYTLPTLTSDMTFRYVSTENVAPTASDPGTGNATLTARKIAAQTDFSGETTEDSIVPLVPALRQTLIRRAAQAIDDLLVSGDTETGATDNVNSDDAALAAGSFSLAIDGIRKFCLVTNTAQVSNVAGALSTANFTTLRRLLGKYGARASDLRLVTPASVYVSMQDIDAVNTVEKYGPNATIVQGELARFFGIPILIYEAIPHLSSDLVEADGKASTTASNNTLGWVALFNVAGWRQGFRRELTVESDRNISTDTNTLVCSFRMALIPSGIDTIHSAVGRNITV